MANIVIVYMLGVLTCLKGFHAMNLFWIFGFIPGLSITVDILNYLYGSHVPPLCHVYIIPAMNILVMLLYRRRFIINRNKLKKLTDQLDGEEAKSLYPGEKTVLTVQLKTKLQALKDYMAMHYNTALTRDILAEKMALNPDYMSRMFKSHEGVKINHYINNLRVDEACHLLRRTDRKIIDIAFAVGFESLATFNRAFIKKHNVSPSEYRLLNTLNSQD